MTTANKSKKRQTKDVRIWARGWRLTFEWTQGVAKPNPFEKRLNPMAKEEITAATIRGETVASKAETKDKTVKMIGFRTRSPKIIKRILTPGLPEEVFSDSLLAN